ncbi:MAG: gluconate 2-dehydrogenase subunit 3 family protein [Gemmatimonadota bacterium]
MIDNEPVLRRTFLIDAARLAAGGLLASELQLLAGCARDDGNRDVDFNMLTVAEGRAMRALAAQICPRNGDLPGANDAGVVYFVDRVFGMPFFADAAALIRSGLADLDARATIAGKHADFAAASDEEQIAIMRVIDKSPFFIAARTLVVIGMFSDPKYGGNRGEVGWSLLGIEHRPSFTAPFGFYDAQVSAPAAPGAA